MHPYHFHRILLNEGESPKLWTHQLITHSILSLFTTFLSLVFVHCELYLYVQTLLLGKKYLICTFYKICQINLPCFAHVPYMMVDSVASSRLTMPVEIYIGNSWKLVMRNIRYTYKYKCVPCETWEIWGLRKYIFKKWLSPVINCGS